MGLFFSQGYQNRYTISIGAPIETNTVDAPIIISSFLSRAIKAEVFAIKIIFKKLFVSCKNDLEKKNLTAQWYP